MPEKIITKRFRLPITVERRAEIGHDLASTLNRIDSVESQKKQAADGYKAELELLDQKARRLRFDIDEERADFDIEVFIEQDFNANAIRYRRLLRDTVNSGALPDDQQKGEVLEERAMTAEEREAAAQMPLGPIVDVPLCGECSHPWSEAKNPRQEGLGHAKKSGKCHYTSRDTGVKCDCQAFMPIVDGGGSDRAEARP